MYVFWIKHRFGRLLLLQGLLLFQFFYFLLFSLGFSSFSVLLFIISMHLLKELGSLSLSVLSSFDQSVYLLVDFI